mmetsp:Transcript_15068/g.10944  ORF Transcript_15068/g.10944 Transcript_15068/m.10944 type:complete len:90 (+) Transcript_15068:341-610(+)
MCLSIGLPDSQARLDLLERLKTLGKFEAAGDLMSEIEGHSQEALDCYAKGGKFLKALRICCTKGLDAQTAAHLQSEVKVAFDIKRNYFL